MVCCGVCVLVWCVVCVVCGCYVMCVGVLICLRVVVVLFQYCCVCE